MKAIKVFLLFAGFTLTGICFGQLVSQNNSDLLFYSSHYDLASNRMEHRLDPFPARSTSGDHFETPGINRTYYVHKDFDMAVETWMTIPFESSIYEEELQLESWMTTPFDCMYYEENPIIESWMTKPFESGEEIEIEEWMTTIWI